MAESTTCPHCGRQVYGDITERRIAELHAQLRELREIVEGLKPQPAPRLRLVDC